MRRRKVLDFCCVCLRGVYEGAGMCNQVMNWMRGEARYAWEVVVSSSGVVGLLPVVRGMGGGWGVEGGHVEGRCVCGALLSVLGRGELEWYGLDEVLVWRHFPMIGVCVVPEVMPEVV